MRADDGYISVELEVFGGWEMDEVSSVMEVVDMYPEATFVGNFILNLIINLIYRSDAGSNIGVYSLGTFQLIFTSFKTLKKNLAVASLKRPVIAVDMMADNLAFIRESLKRAKLTDYVELINNAIR